MTTRGRAILPLGILLLSLAAVGCGAEGSPSPTPTAVPTSGKPPSPSLRWLPIAPLAKLTTA